MLKNYLRIALRNLRKHPAYTVINVVGLAVGMACCLLILLYVRDELSYDRFHANAHRVYRVINTRFADGEAVQRASTPPAMGPTLVSEFPEVLAAVRVFDMGKSLVTYEDRQFFEPNVVLADSTLFEVFTFPLVKGDPATALSAPYGLLVTETMARKYFGDEEPIGKTLRVGGDLTFQVTGVLRDLPAQSHLRPDFIGSFATLQEFVPPERLRNWIWQQFTTYVLLPEGRDAAALEAKLPAFIARRT